MGPLIEEKGKKIPTQAGKFVDVVVGNRKQFRFDGFQFLTDK